jgi:hypothetical protein
MVIHYIKSKQGREGGGTSPASDSTATKKDSTSSNKKTAVIGPVTQSTAFEKAEPTTNRLTEK